MSLGAGAIAGMVIGALIVLFGGAYTIHVFYRQPSDKGQSKIRPPEDTKGLAAVVPA
jgi:hypothetical protein